MSHMGMNRIFAVLHFIFLMFPALGYAAASPYGGSGCTYVQGTSATERVLVCPSPSDRPPARPPRPSGSPSNGGGTGGNSGGSTNPSDPQTEASAVCVQRFQEMKSSCQSRVESTSHSCDSNKDQGMKGVMSKAAEIATIVGAMTASNVNASCSKAAGLVQGANAAVAAYRLNCSNSVSNCVDTCQDLVDFMNQNQTCFGETYYQYQDEAKSIAIGCNGFENKIQEANQAIQNYAQTAASAAQCDLNSNGMDTYCEQNPNSAGCATQAAANCSDPVQASTNKICICAANPYAMECGQQAANAGGAGAGSADFSSRLKSAQDSGGYSGQDIPGFPSIEQAALNKKTAQEIGGRQGAGNPVSGANGAGGGAGSGGAGGGVPGEPNGSAVNAGFYGGGGKFGSGGGAGGVAGQGIPGAGRGFASTGNSPGGPDLRKFLPGGAYDPKRLNGGVLGTTGKDGITGPHTNIWMKIQNRYRVMSPTLLP